MSNQPDLTEADFEGAKLIIVLTIDLAQTLKPMSPTDAKAHLVKRHLPVWIYDTIADFNARKISLQDCVRRIEKPILAMGNC